jgi:hypothetical protein
MVLLASMKTFANSKHYYKTESRIRISVSAFDSLSLVYSLYSQN